MITQAMQALMILCALSVASASVARPSSCPRPCDCFVADNGIPAANCTDLPDQTTTAWPQKVVRIHFKNHRGTPPSVMLKNKAFKHFPGLTYLDITGGAIKYVGNSAFDGLPELVELNMVGTGVSKLPRNVFASNRKLAFVSLKRNGRLFVGPSFLVSESITELDLSECGLSALKSAYFKGLPNLKYLFAAGNQLRSLGSQFGPSGLKYVNVAHNHIETVDGDLDVYKRLRTIDLTGNPVNCTCELSEVDKRLTARGVAFGNMITCANTGVPLADLADTCMENGMMGDEPADIYSAENLLKFDKNKMETRESVDDFGSGSGSGDGELFVLPQGNDVKLPVTTTTMMTAMMTTTTTSSTTERSVTKSTENDIVPVTTTPKTVEEEVIKTVIAHETMVNRPATSETNKVETTENTVVTTIIPVASTTVSPVIVAASTTEESTTAVSPTVPTVITACGDGNNSSTARSSVDHVVIVSQTIQAPDDGVIGENVQAKVTNYIKSNVGVTVTAAILAVVIIAIVYKATCAAKLRSHSIRHSADHDESNGKIIELKDVKYVSANTDDSPSTGGSAEENLLEDRSDDDDDDDNDDDDDEDGTTSSPSPPTPATNDNRYDLLNSVMGAMEDGVKSNGSHQDPQQLQVPTRVIVKLCETPKASRPITIDNVH